MDLTHITNFATNTRWVASLPFATLFPSEGQILMSLHQFDIPEVSIGVTDIAYTGYTIEQPTGLIQPEDKSITFSYTLDASMRVYNLLYKWCQFFTNTKFVDVVKGDEGDQAPLSKTIPISVFILSEFKKPIMKITYYDCWIKNFANLSMSYQDEPVPLTHAFTVAYSRFEIEEV